MRAREVVGGAVAVVLAAAIPLAAPRARGGEWGGGGRARGGGGVGGGGGGVVVGGEPRGAASLAGTAATEAARWPGVLDVLRRHPWASLAVMLVLTGALLALDRRREAASARPAPPPSVVPPPPAWLVDREETERAVEAVLAGNAGTVGLTTGLQG
ncbi:hypothetical protein ACFV3O_29950, partial [Streptomyces albidoflavus]